MPPQFRFSMRRYASNAVETGSTGSQLRFDGDHGLGQQLDMDLEKDLLEAEANDPAIKAIDPQNATHQMQQRDYAVRAPD